MVVRIGVLGAARISGSALFVPARDIPGVSVEGVAARDKKRAAVQVAEFGLARTYECYADVLADERIHAIYNPLPISLHHEWTMAALAAGKHVLCEKPFASNAAQAKEMVELAEAKGLVLMEAFHWRYHPLAERLGALLDAEVVGEVQRIEAAFSTPIDPSDGIRSSWELSGGALMDLGCYPIQWVRFAAGEEPSVVGATMAEGNQFVDVTSHVDLVFPSGATGQVFTSMVDCEDGAWLSVTGSKGTLQVKNPLAPHHGNRLLLTQNGTTTTEVIDGESTYHYQLEAFRDAIVDGRPLPTGGQDAIATMELIDAAYEAAGLPIRGSELAS